MDCVPASQLTALFEEFGNGVANAWLQVERDERRLPAIAADHLRQARLHEKVNLEELHIWAATQRIPNQLDLSQSFGNPPVTVYQSNRFVIDVYTWFHSTTTAHQHAFSGAFCVLLGGSVHAKMSFTESRRVNENLRLGTLSTDAVEVLGVGDVREVPAGDAFIHRLYHLDHPSATIIIRTKGDMSAAPQYSYAEPSVGFNPFFQTAEMTRRHQCLDALWKISKERYIDTCEAIASQVDMFERFLLLREVADATGEHDRAMFLSLLNRVFAARPDGAAELRTALVEHGRILGIQGLRKKVTDAELRFFLALLLNVPDRARIEAQVLARHPDTPAKDTIAKWIVELTRKHAIGLPLNDAQVEMIRILLDGATNDQVIDRLAAEYGDGEIREHTAPLVEFCDAARAQAIYRPLFTLA